MSVSELVAPESALTEAAGRPRLRLVTGLGDIVIELRPDRAPVSVAAFLAQVDSGAYDGGSFGRVVRADNDRGAPLIEVVQAFLASSTTIIPVADVPLETTDETGLIHQDGTISLPRSDGGDGSAQSFFICVGPQPALDAGGARNPDGRGFAAFGKVVAGMDLVRAIHRAETLDEAPHEYVQGQLPADPVPIHRLAREADAPAARLAGLAADYWSFRVREFPLEAGAAGVREANARLDGASEADYARRARLCEALLARARAIDPTALAGQDAITLSLLTGQLGFILEAFRLGDHRRPRLFPFGPTDIPDWLAKTTTLESYAERDDFAARMLAMPAFFRDCLDQLRAGFAEGCRLPRVLVPRILAVLDSHLSSDGGLAERVAGRLASDAGAADRSAEQRARIAAIVAEEVLPAIAAVRNYVAGLDGELTDGVSVCDEPDGRAWYRYKVRHQTSLDLEPDAVHALGLDEIARIGDEVDEVLVRMGRAGEREAVAAELEARVAADPAALLDYTRAFAKQVDGRLPKLIGRMPRISYGVEQLAPLASAALPPALAQPSPADRSMPGVYWITALPDRCPLHLIVPLTLHEAWPGHLMQFALAHELDALPDFRRYGWTDYNGYVEGWALYCERLGHELGLYDDPADHFGLLSFELWRAARLVVDTGLHWKGWSRQQAIDFMVANTFLPRETIEGEVDRYIGMPAQALSYKIGERAISALRAEAESALGESLSLRDFHDEILALGPVSLEALRSHLRRWIETRQAA